MIKVKNVLATPKFSKTSAMPGISWSLEAKATCPGSLDANGGLVGSGNIDLQGLRQEVVAAVSDSIGVIQVTNVATDTTSQAIKVNNIEQEASFG